MKEALPNTHNGSDLVTFFERALFLMILILIVRANHIANIAIILKPKTLSLQDESANHLFA